MLSKKEREAAEREWLTKTIPMTAAGKAHLEEKLARLKGRLPELVQETARTAAYGDRSDNAEYADAKRALRRAQWQILQIEDELKRIELIPQGPAPGGAVRLGSRVTLEAANGSRKTYELVGPAETDPARGRISHLSPLGAALIGRKPGETISAPAPGGKKEYVIRKTE